MTPAQHDELLAALRLLTESVNGLRHDLQQGHVEAITGENAAAMAQISLPQFRSLVANGQAPKAIELGERCPRWLVSELREWLKNRPRRQRQAKAAA